MRHIFSLNRFQSLPSQAKLNDAPAAVSEVSWQVARQAERVADMAFYSATADGWHCNVCDEDFRKTYSSSQHRDSHKHKAAARKKELALVAPPALDVAMPEAKDDDEGKAMDDDDGKAKDDVEGKAKDDDEGKANDDDEGKAKDEPMLDQATGAAPADGDKDKDKDEPTLDQAALPAEAFAIVFCLNRFQSHISGQARRCASCQEAEVVRGHGARRAS